MSRLTRREAICHAVVCGAGICLPGADKTVEQPRSRPSPRKDKPGKKLAVVTSAYYYLSHAYHICGRFLNGYLREGKMHYPDFGIAGMYVEQQKASDLSRELARKHGFTLYPDIAGALTIGSDRL